MVVQVVAQRVDQVDGIVTGAGACMARKQHYNMQLETSVHIRNIQRFVQTIGYFIVKMKKCSEAIQTLRAGCSKEEPKSFAPLQTPFLGAQDCQNLISWRYLQTQFGEDRCTQFRVIMVTDPQTNKQTDRGDYNTLHSLARSVITNCST